MSAEPLLSVYLLTGSDRPKHLRALRRLRARFGPEAVEQLSAESTTGADAVAACNALGLFGGHDGGRLVIVEGVERWRKADLEAVETYLRNPVEGAVLALYAEGPLRGTTLADLVGKHGQVLDYNVPKPNNLHRWVAGEFKRLDIKADADASRALVEIVGDDTMALSNEILKLGAWAGGEPIGRADVERLAAPARESAAWALTDAWGARDLPTLLEACELAFENNDEPFLLAVRLASHVGRVRTAQAMAEEGLGARDVAARLKIKDFPARKALQHADRYSRAELDAALVRLADLDAAIKGASRLSSELELLRALIDVTRPAEQPVAVGLALRDEPRGLGLLPRRGVPVDRASSSRPVDPALKRRVLGRDRVLVAGLDRSLEPTRDRLHGRPVAQVLAAIVGGRAHALLLLLDVRHP